MNGEAEEVKRGKRRTERGSRKVKRKGSQK